MGTNLALLQLMWTILNGSFLPSRGAIFPALKAKQYGLVDEIGFIEDAIARASELAGLDDGVRVVEYRRPASLVNLVGMAQASSERSELNMILEMSAPRAYYLATTLPPLLSTKEWDPKSAW